MMIDTLDSLPLAFPVQSTEIATYFNQIARPNDTALVMARATQTLTVVNSGRRVVVYASWAEAEQSFDGLPDRPEMIGYNPEHWDQTPASEQQNLVATVRRAEKFAQQRGLPLLVAPDRQFTQQFGAAMAPHADVLVFQGQRLQHDPAQYSRWIGTAAGIARSANPSVEIWAQVSLAIGTPEQAYAAAQSVVQTVDGLSVWSSPQTLAELKAFVGLIRPAAAS